MKKESVPTGGHSIRMANHADWSELEPLWTSLYEHQREHGMLIDLPSDAYELWIASFQPLLGRFAFVFVAEHKNSLVGFLAGKVRSLPPHFGGHQVGYLSELLVLSRYRRQGIADQLLSTARDWFRERNIRRMELPVVIDNVQARDFYIRRGWKAELTQMVWQEEPVGI